jgi:hypothetical protein
MGQATLWVAREVWKALFFLLEIVFLIKINIEV